MDIEQIIILSTVAVVVVVGIKLAFVFKVMSKTEDASDKDTDPQDS